jgi:hypothetical protein
MKPWIAISAALAVTALATVTFSHAATADVVYQPFGLNPAYQVPSGPLTPSARPYYRHRHVARYQPYYPLTPAACEAVIFPRSPLCAGRPGRFSPYSEFPFNRYVYY